MWKLGWIVEFKNAMKDSVSKLWIVIYNTMKNTVLKNGRN